LVFDFFFFFFKNEVQVIDLVEQEIIRKRQAGTPVTVESFMAWRASFEAEKNYF